MKVKPLMSIQHKTPTVVIFRDQGTQNNANNRILGRGMLIGALGLTYPQNIIINI